MDSMSFQQMANDFRSADLDKKIDLYVNTEGLTQDQYKELLRMFPMNELHRLEAALA